MGGGKGGGGEIPKEVQDTAKILRDIGVQNFDLGIPLTQQGGKFAEELLKTGNVGAMQPAIGQAVEGARSSQSQGMQDILKDATLQGLTGTALQDKLAQSRIGAESAVAGVAPSFFTPFLQQVGGPAFDLPEQGLNAIGQAGQIGGVAAGPARKSGGAGGALGGAASGAMMGAALGPMGMAAGAVLGGVMGSKVVLTGLLTVRLLEYIVGVLLT
jgi:hypothetical protein